MTTSLIMKTCSNTLDYHNHKLLVVLWSYSLVVLNNKVSYDNNQIFLR